MKAFKTLLMAGLLALSAAAIAQNEKPYLTKSFPAAGFKNLKVETSGGSLTVLGQNAGDARIEMYVQGNNDDNLSDAEIKERLEKYYQVSIDKDATTLTAIAKRIDNGNWNWRNHLSISFKVFVPTAMSSDLRTSGGSINLSNLNGEQKAVTSGGSINLENLEGNAFVRTSGGSIEVGNITGTLDAVTSGGSIRATGNLGNSKLKTSGGSIRLNSVSGSLEAHTSGGGIHADIASLGERLSLSTSGGSIEVKMPMDKGMDLDLKGNKVQVAMNNFNGVVEDDRVQGKLNGGGIPVSIHTSGGRVRIN
jgi:hypothetical protein